MRIVRYELEIVDYQQVQPLWPGRILAVKPGRIGLPLTPVSAADVIGTDYYDGQGGYWRSPEQKIDMWCVDAEVPVDEIPPTQIPVLGVWIVGTGNPMPDEVERSFRHQIPALIADPSEPQHQETCVMSDGLVWHVFTAVVGQVQPIETGYGEVSSVDDIAAKVAERRRAELQRVAEMTRDA